MNAGLSRSRVFRSPILRAISELMLGQGLVMALSLPASVLLARVLGPAGLGSFMFAQRVASLALLVLHLSIAHGLSYSSASTTDIAVVRKLVYTSLEVTAVVAPLAAAVAFCVSVQAVDGTIALLFVLFLPSVLLSQLLAHVLRGQLKTRAYNAVRVAQPASWLITLVGLYIAGVQSLTVYVIGFVASHAVAAITAYLYCVRYGWKPSKSGEFRSAVVRYGLRAHFGQAGRDANVYLDQVILGFLLPRSSLGLYSVAANTTLAVSGINSALLPVIQPMVQKAPAEARRRTAYRLLALTSLGLGVVIAILIVPMPWLIRLLYGPEYIAASAAVQILLVAVLFDSISSAASAVLFGLNRPGRSSLATFVAVAVGLVLLLILTPVWGIDGAALASAGSYMSGMVINLWGVYRWLRRP